LAMAKTAFSNGVTCYLAGSQSVRSRPTNTVRLFNFNGSRAEHEEHFRSVLTDLRTSLTNGPVTLAVDSDIMVYLPALFTGTHPIRSFLPQFRGDRFVLGTLEPTLGGAVFGIEQEKWEKFLAKNLEAVP